MVNVHDTELVTGKEAKELLKRTSGVRTFKVTVVYLVCTDTQENALKHVKGQVSSFYQSIESKALPLRLPLTDESICYHPTEGDELNEDIIPF